MNTLRLNPPMDWRFGRLNVNFLYFCQMLSDLGDSFDHHNQSLRMLEIGSYRGESTLLFASLGIFKEIHCIDPFKGFEEANKLFNNTWDEVKEDFEVNTRYFDNIILHQNFSYNVNNRFSDKFFNFIYIDANHSYENVKMDLELYLPKCSGIIGGHDYTDRWPGVISAVNEMVGVPDKIYGDGSWIKKLKD